MFFQLFFGGRTLNTIPSANGSRESTSSSSASPPKVIIWYISFSLMEMTLKPDMNSSSRVALSVSYVPLALSRSSVTFLKSSARVRYSLSFSENASMEDMSGFMDASASPSAVTFSLCASAETVLICSGVKSVGYASSHRASAIKRSISPVTFASSPCQCVALPPCSSASNLASSSLALMSTSTCLTRATMAFASSRAVVTEESSELFSSTSTCSSFCVSRTDMASSSSVANAALVARTSSEIAARSPICSSMVFVSRCVALACDAAVACFVTIASPARAIASPSCLTIFLCETNKSPPTPSIARCSVSTWFLKPAASAVSFSRAQVASPTSFSSCFSCAASSDENESARCNSANLARKSPAFSDAAATSALSLGKHRSVLATAFSASLASLAAAAAAALASVTVAVVTASSVSASAIAALLFSESSSFTGAMSPTRMRPPLGLFPPPDMVPAVSMSCPLRVTTRRRFAPSYAIFDAASRSLATAVSRTP
mmetsp:Transcript_13188/g.49311  ORF Transcript_13188/g.49311 Transcript_13188/m.49311 type:complete len:490 (-) Transcript_13188:1977-3446(-)